MVEVCTKLTLEPAAPTLSVYIRIIGDGSAIDSARYGSGASNNTCCQRSRIRTIIIVRHRAQCAKGRSEHDSVAACGQVVYRWHPWPEP